VQQVSQAVGTFAQIHTNANATSHGGSDVRGTITVRTEMITRLSVTAFQPSVAVDGNRGISTAVSPAAQELRATSSLVSVAATNQDNGLPTALGGDAAPRPVVPLTTAPRTEKRPELSEVKIGAYHAPAASFGTLPGQALSDSPAAFWLDQK